MGKIQLVVALFFCVFVFLFFSLFYNHSGSPCRVPFNGKTETSLLTVKIQCKSYVRKGRTWVKHSVMMAFSELHYCGSPPGTDLYKYGVHRSTGGCMGIEVLSFHIHQ